MSENKTKLNLRPSVITAEKSPPPTGLLISHGKPNFTIQRSKKSGPPTPTKPSVGPFGTLNNKIVLKKTNRNLETPESIDDNCTKKPTGPPTPTKPIIGPFGTLKNRITHKKPNGNLEIANSVEEDWKKPALPTPAKPSVVSFGTLNNRVVLKKTIRNIETAKTTENDGNTNEFLEAHKKISEKLSKDNGEIVKNTENVVYNNNNSNNNNHSAMDNNFSKHYIHIHNGNLVNGHQNGVDHLEKQDQNQKSSMKLNCGLKPDLPEKPPSLQNYKPISPTANIINSVVPPPPPPPNFSNGVNFEQKTVVSFSKDLCTGPNNYPDTVKISKPADNGVHSMQQEVIKELSKLKFEITSNGEAIVPVIQNI